MTTEEINDVIEVLEIIKNAATHGKTEIPQAWLHTIESIADFEIRHFKEKIVLEETAG